MRCKLIGNLPATGTQYFIEDGNKPISTRGPILNSGNDTIEPMKSKDYYDSNNFSDGADGSGDLPAARQGLSIHPDYRAYVGTPSDGYKGFKAATNHVYKL